ncbi:MAG: helix-turn-helix transcriptional regulator [Clostridia bacterium]|nr:helix-turn-helix transcriptional regulator [Clostridia bacterium]
MNDVKSTVSKNIAELRIACGMTQAELGAVLNYSDKAVSKWERGESIPDVTVLAEICRIFEVSLDDMIKGPVSSLSAEKAEEEAVRAAREAGTRLKKHVVITLMSICLVWLIAVLGYILWKGVAEPAENAWIVFIYAVTVSAIVLLVFAGVWFSRKTVFPAVTLLMWSLLASVFFSLLVFGGINFWLLFLIGIPGQIIILLWLGITPVTVRRQRKNTGND